MIKPFPVYHFGDQTYLKALIEQSYGSQCTKLLKNDDQTHLKVKRKHALSKYSLIKTDHDLHQ